MLRPLLLVFLLSFFSKVKSQDPIFSQYYNNPLYLNPVFAGSEKSIRLGVNYRLQWLGISGGYTTYSISYDQFINKISSGIGFLAMNDIQGNGIITNSNFGLVYSFDKKINDKISFKLGTQGMLTRSVIDLSKSRLTFGDQIDSRYGFVYQTNDSLLYSSKLGIDFSLGGLIYNDKFDFGIVLHHPTQPDYGFINSSQSRLNYRLSTHGRLFIPIGEESKKMFVLPSFIYNIQSVFQEFNLGVSVMKKFFIGGVSYRFKDAVITTLGYQSRVFKVNYSFDITTSVLGLGNKGSHELSLRYVFKKKEDR